MDSEDSQASSLQKPSCSLPMEDQKSNSRFLGQLAMLELALSVESGDSDLEFKLCRCRLCGLQQVTEPLRTLILKQDKVKERGRGRSIFHVYVKIILLSKIHRPHASLCFLG